VVGFRVEGLELRVTEFIFSNTSSRGIGGGGGSAAAARVARGAGVGRVPHFHHTSVARTTTRLVSWRGEPQ